MKPKVCTVPGLGPVGSLSRGGGILTILPLCRRRRTQRRAATGGQIADVHASDKQILEGE